MENEEVGLDCTVFHTLAHYHSEDQCSSYEKSNVVSMAFLVYKKVAFATM